jgi:hypothetical protein
LVAQLGVADPDETRVHVVVAVSKYHRSFGYKPLLFLPPWRYKRVPCVHVEAPVRGPGVPLSAGELTVDSPAIHVYTLDVVLYFQKSWTFGLAVGSVLAVVPP